MNVPWLKGAASHDFKSLAGSAHLTYAAFAFSAMRNLYLAHGLGPELLAVNSMSTQLLTLVAFLDLGAVLALKQEIPRTREGTHERSNVILRTRYLTYLSYVYTALAMSLLGVINWRQGNSHWGLAFLATAVIAPVQGTIMFRSAVYNASHKQVRGSLGMFIASLTNLVITPALFHEIGPWVIVLCPAFSFLVAFSVDNRLSDSARYSIRKVVKFRFREIPIDARKRMLLLAGSQLLAISVVNTEAYYSFGLLSAHDAGKLGLVINLLVVLTVFPIMLSTLISPLINHHMRALAQVQIRRYLLDANSLLLSILSCLTLFGTVLFQGLINIALPGYEGAIPSMWILVFATYLYCSTFYASTYAMSHDQQPKVVKAQVIALSVQLMLIVTLVHEHRLTLVTLALTALAKMTIYQFIHSHYMHKISSGELLSPLNMFTKSLVSGLFLGLGCLASFSDRYVLLGICLLGQLMVTCIQLPSAWKAFKASSQALRLHYSERETR
jgi:hypothetical protein